MKVEYFTEGGAPLFWTYCHTTPALGAMIRDGDKLYQVGKVRWDMLPLAGDKRTPTVQVYLEAVLRSKA